MTNEHQESIFSAKYLLLLLAALLLGFSIVGAISIWTDTHNERDKFEEEVFQVREFILQRLNSLETVLISLAGIHHSSDVMNSAEFSGFANEFLTAYPYITSIVWTERVDQDKGDSFISSKVEQGLIGFRFKSFEDKAENTLSWLNGKLVVSQIEPLTPLSAKLLGYDITTSSGIAKAISQAADNGNISSSGPITLYTNNKSSYLVLKAIYLGRYPPDSVSTRRNMLNGFVALEMEATRFLKDIPFNQQELFITLNGMHHNDLDHLELPPHKNQQDTRPKKFRLLTLSSELDIDAYGQSMHISLSREVGFEVINSWKLFTSLIVTFMIIFLGFTVFRIRHLASIREEKASIAIFEEGERFTQVIDTAFDAVITIDTDGKILSWNQKARKIFGYEKSFVEGQLLLPLILSADAIRQYGNIFNEFFSAEKLDKQGFKIEVTGLHKDGREFPLELSTAISYIGERAIISIFARDISERKESEERIRHLAYYDSLTNLPNRQSFKIQTDLAIKSAIRNNRIGAVIFIDLDEFKRINDTLGHDSGDLLIKQVSQRLLEHVRENDAISLAHDAPQDQQNIARLGGDEFTILLTEIKDENDAGLVARRIQQNIDRSFNLNGHEVYITPSIGIAIFPHDGREVDELLKHADTAMYHAKALGKNNFQFYSEQMGARAAEHLRLEGKLRKSLSNGEMQLYYQPQISPKTGKIYGAEALIRWNQAELGMIPPDTFIPLAEDTGMILDIGDWVLKEACEQNARWQAAGYAPIRVAVNLSGLQFIQKDLQSKVESMLQKTGLSSEHLELEITESIIMRNIEQTIDTLQSFRDMQIGVSVDDFGTGYSSLGYLKKFPLESLKIDRSFITDIPQDVDDVKITSAILAMAQSLNLKVVAEGVETPQQAAFLTMNNCDLLQGYLYSRPLPADEFEKLLADNKQWEVYSHAV